MSARAMYKFRTAAPLNCAFHWPSEGAAGVSEALFPSRLQDGHGTVILSVSKAATSDVLNFPSWSSLMAQKRMWRS